jgi:hypothetical protein
MFTSSRDPTSAAPRRRASINGLTLEGRLFRLHRILSHFTPARGARCPSAKDRHRTRRLRCHCPDRAAAAIRASAARADEKDPADNPLGRGCDADATRIVTIGFAARPAHKSGGIDRWPPVKSSRDPCAVTQAQAAHPHPLPSHGDDVGRAPAAHTLAAVLPCLGARRGPHGRSGRVDAPRTDGARACTAQHAAQTFARAHACGCAKSSAGHVSCGGRQRARQRSARYRADRDAGARLSPARLEVAGTGRAPF